MKRRVISFVMSIVLLTGSLPASATTVEEALFGDTGAPAASESEYEEPASAYVEGSDDVSEDAVAEEYPTLALGDQLLVSTDVPVPLVGNFPAGSWALTLSTPPVRWMRPCSTAPPDSGGGGYLLYATRIHPRA